MDNFGKCGIKNCRAVSNQVNHGYCRRCKYDLKIATIVKGLTPAQIKMLKQWSEIWHTSSDFRRGGIHTLTALEKKGLIEIVKDEKVYFPAYQITKLGYVVKVRLG